ncbi:MAG: YhbY family RNA-binding protein [Eubacteriales bacterium]|nr:YhbY family RNA-binding protein [Eubacteriales bacterium]MDD4140067.1 YhbY family RNA-binding protein [Eubacteriales bacterium]MDD4743390.1 YhbY family RNA-binding protein [Eubacteriales bacterium]
MISSKQRAWLRSRANTMDADFHVGKEPWNPAMADSLAELLSTHELVKAVVLKSAAEPVRSIAAKAAESVGADIVQVIGRRFVLYKPSEKLARLGKSLPLPL